MTQAAVSYQVKSLEERLGAPLFVREKGRARLTSARRPAAARPVERVRRDRGGVREPSRGRRIAADHHDHAHLRQHLARVAARRVPDRPSRAGGEDDDQQRGRGPALGRCRRRDPRRARRLGGLEHHELFKSSFTPMASPDCIAEVEAELGRKLEPDDIPHQHLINPSDDWWQQWFADNGVPADDAVFRRPGVRLDSQADEGHAAMAGQGFALADAAAVEGRRRGRAARDARFPTGFRPAAGLIGWSIRASGGWRPRSSASANGCSPRWSGRRPTISAAGRSRSARRAE